MSPGGAPRPSFEQASEQVKQKSREQQGQVRESMGKTDKGIEQISQQASSYRSAIKNIKNAIVKLQAQAQENPQIREHPMYQKRLAAYREKLKGLRIALSQVEGRLEMLRSRKLQLRTALVKIAGRASAQLGMLRQRQDAAKQQSAAAQGQQQQKKKAAKAESGKIRG